MKKHIGILSIVILLMTVLSINVSAAENIDSGYCGGESDGKNLTWSVTDDGTLRISGEGAMANFTSGGTAQYPWSPYRGDIQSIVVDDGVTTIGNFAFNYLSSVTSVELPETLVSIGVNAFGCSSLQSIIIPKGVEEIGVIAFACPKLSVMIFEGDAPAFDSYALDTISAVIYYSENNSAWESAIKKNYGGNIAWLENSGGWVDITGYYGAENDGKNIMWVLSEEGKLTISGTGEMQNGSGLYSSPLYKYRGLITNVYIEEGVEIIGSFLFQDCYNMTSIEMPSSVTNIGMYAFYGCTNLKNIQIPSEVTELGSYAFVDCQSVREIILPDLVSTFEGMFMRCTSLESVNIPDGVTSLDRTFFGCTSLETVELPDSIESMHGTFANCSSLKEIILPSNVTSIDGCFSGCPSLTSIVIPIGVETIGAGTFGGCTSLASIEFLGDVKEIGIEAFTATAIEAITLPASIETVCGNAFNNCDDLQTIRFDGSAPELPDAEWGVEVFTGVEATAYYPANDDTWTGEIMQAFGGDITWIAYTDCGVHTWKEVPCEKKTVCTVCGYSKGTEMGHDWDDGVVTIAPTCTSEGERTYTCKRNPAHTYKDEIAPIVHKFDNAILKFRWGEDFSCLVDVFCANLCGATEQHSCDVSSVRVEGADCQTKGSTIYTAKYGSYSDVKTVEGFVGEHKPGANATCTKDQLCTVCKAVLNESVGHDFDRKVSGVLASNATCNEPATYYVQCNNCTEITREKVVSVGKATGHDFDSEIVKFQWSDDNGCVVSIYCANLCGETEDHTCEVTTITVDGRDCQTKGSIISTAKYGSYSDVRTSEGTIGSHKPGAEATCMTDQLCTVCKVVLKESKGHAFDCKVSDTLASNATCTEPATYFVQCDNCSEITRDKTVSVGEEKGHDYGDPFFSWAEDLSSASAVVICSDCGQGIQSSTAEMTWSSDAGKLSVIAKITLAETTYTDIKVITAKVSDGKVVISLPKEMLGVTVYAAGYGANQAMALCDFECAKKTLVELEVTGKTVKLFFLDSETLVPLMPSLIIN